MNLIESYLTPLDLHSILAVGPAPWLDLVQHCQQAQIELTFAAINDTPPPRRYDLGIIYGTEHADPSVVRHRLGELKNYLSERVWLLVDDESTWQLTDFVALGFRKDTLPEGCNYQSYSYNLETYNYKRDWNNPRFWANPENWNLRF